MKPIDPDFEEIADLDDADRQPAAPEERVFRSEEREMRAIRVAAARGVRIRREHGENIHEFEARVLATLAGPEVNRLH